MANKKLTECKACGSEIAKGGKVVCPKCGKVNKKPIYLRTWFIVVGVIILLSIFGSFLGGNQNDSLATTNNSANESISQTENNSNQVEDVVDNETLSQKNAIKKAENYLRSMAFSREGLINQLEFEKFSNEDSVYAVDKINVNWKEQAVLKADSYLKTMAFSKTGLINQLSFEGFTDEEADYGVNGIQVDWMEQAVLKAKDYLRTMSFSRQGLIDQLTFEGFTNEEATHAVNEIGL